MLLKVFTIIMAVFVLSSHAIAGNNGLIGALLGAGVGAGIGHAVDRTGGSGKGAIIGAIGGYVIGNQLEKNDQAAPQEPAAQPATQQTQSGSRLQSSGKQYQNCNNAEQYVDRATKTNNNDDRIYYLEKAVHLCPTQARAHNDLGVAYYKRNARHDKDRAKSEFQRTVNIEPGYTVAQNNLNNL